MRSMKDIDYRKVTFVPDVITQKLFSCKENLLCSQYSHNEH